ncbi:glutaminyl-peptide cyclotransferase [Streptomyces sp. MNU89]|uniref:glutaminyl-peptide cyclotransferase n=1 Tax=Streptomyces sp. MNU89 TaxID=2560025 RepID=UPI001E384D99|nr:glutaminyl-peptide cyclotransferase [Streptomyces sp. MNU89]MCC9740259.1 glutaminyl-peptide cyclotransferase [Streptomyces sp. MNU89]
MRALLAYPAVAAVAVAGAVLVPSCGTDGGSPLRPEAAAPPAADRVDQLRAEVLDVMPHDPRAYTQGLEMVGGTLYESTGMAGESSVRLGPPGRPPTVRADLPEPLFGEGITVLGPTLWQLTWLDHIAIERDARTLAELRRVPYAQEGWGVCHQPGRGRLVTSDGSSRLTFRNPRTLAPTGEVAVTLHGRPVPQLNELECVGDSVYANVWPSSRIVRVNAGTGRVTAEIDASGLPVPGKQRHAAVLNGIAAVPGTDEFLLTGKWWPRMYRVALVAR